MTDDPNAEAGFDEFWRQVMPPLRESAEHTVISFDALRRIAKDAYCVGWIDAETHVLQFGMSAGDGVRLTLNGVTHE